MKNPKYNLYDKVYAEIEDEIRECIVMDVREELVNGEYEASYALESPFGICTRHEDDVYRTKREALEAYGDLIIWAMCPYCEEEVELYGTGDENCPRCGATFTPSEEEIQESINNQ